MPNIYFERFYQIYVFDYNLCIIKIYSRITSGRVPDGRLLYTLSIVGLLITSIFYHETKHIL